MAQIDEEEKQRFSGRKKGRAVRQENWQEIESESLLLSKAVTTRRGPESWVVIRPSVRITHPYPNQRLSV